MEQFDRRQFLSRSAKAGAGLVLFGGAADLLAACGGGSQAVGAAGADTATATVTGSVHGGTLIIAMTASDIPNLDTSLAGLQGYEGDRFVGNQIYDGLSRFSLDGATQIPAVVTSLATGWTPNATATSWTFTLRRGVTFHDGSPWNADAALFNLDRYANPKNPNYSPAVAAEVALTLQNLAGYTKTDDYTIVINLTAPNAHLYADVTTLYMASPTALAALGSTGFAAKPSGTGPFKFESEVRGQELTLASNTSYWRGPPKLSKLILKPVPDAAGRIAALRSGAVNWAEYPTPDDIAALHGAGYQVLTNSYDHIWPWIFDTSKPPWNDPRVRQAANYAINRAAMSKFLLKNTAEPAYQVAPRANGAYDPANDLYSYNVTKAKQLLTAAGVPHGFRTTVSVPTSGSGNMVPIPMNEELQQDLAAVGIQVLLQPIEWSAMLTAFGTGKMPGGADAMNISLTFQAEATWNLVFNSKSPVNVGHYQSAVVDRALATAQSTVDPTARYKLYSTAAGQITRDAAWLFVVNDRNPRALAPGVVDFVEPRSWFIDLNNVAVKA